MSTGVNVLRWGALGFGIFYGVSHQMTVSAGAKLKAEKREYQHKQSLITKAKEEYQRKTQPQAAGVSNGVISDPEDPKFDLEQWIKSHEKSTA